MYTELEVARLMVYKAALSLEQNKINASVDCAMAKRFATDVGFNICDSAVQLLGGYGYLEEYDVERYFRDLRVHQILEGTNEIMRLIIAKNILQKESL